MKATFNAIDKGFLLSQHIPHALRTTSVYCNETHFRIAPHMVALMMTGSCCATRWRHMCRCFDQRSIQILHILYAYMVSIASGHIFDLALTYRTERTELIKLKQIKQRSISILDDIFFTINEFKYIYACTI